MPLVQLAGVALKVPAHDAEEQGACASYEKSCSMRKILPIMPLMGRRRAGVLVPLEAAILSAGLQLAVRGEPQFYGLQIAREVADETGRRLALVGYGTIYKALARLEDSGLLTSAWEHSREESRSGRPRRRLYQVTPAGAAALGRIEPACQVLTAGVVGG